MSFHALKIKNAHTEGLDVRCIESSSFVCRRIWHLAKAFTLQVAGFHRAVPSTALDKAGMQLLDDYSRILSFVKAFQSLFTIRI